MEDKESKTDKFFGNLKQKLLGKVDDVKEKYETF